MLKRLFLVLAIAGINSTFVHSTQSHSTNGIVFQLNSTIPLAKVDQILKYSAPILGISYPDACTAHQKGSLTIQEVGQSTDLYLVFMKDGPTSIFIDLEDI